MLEWCSFVCITFWAILSILPNLNCSTLNSEYIPQNITRIRRQAKCNFNEFQCKSGECISEDLYCDGKEDCKDGSDETEACKEIQCSQSFLFQCAYGACINGDYECDGKKDCKDNSDETSPKCSTTPQCGVDKFRCNSGQCVSDINLCDGKADCADGSDETVQACRGFPCPGFTYRCGYGACVQGNAKCNGITECIDGSDEKNCTASPRPPIIITTTTTTVRTNEPTEGCIYPNFPQKGTYSIPRLPSYKIEPGRIAGYFTVLEFSCQNGYGLYPFESKHIICIGNNRWDKDAPECRRTCSPLSSSESTNIECSVDNTIKTEYCDVPVEGTIVKFTCKRFYEPYSVLGNTLRCQGGSWDKPTYSCKPECGKRRGEAQTNVVGGNIAEKHDFPWQVAFYKASNKIHICGGSIITPTMIVSAAHCFCNLQNGNPYPKENYVLAVGKHYRGYSDTRDQPYVQYPEIKQIHVHPSYYGQTGQHASDIAVVELGQPLNITAYVQPVCVNLNLQNRNDDLFDNQTGLVIGWGYTVEDGVPSDELKVLEVPYHSRKSCLSMVSDNFKPFITYDKLCAGYESSGQSVCSGDSGGGLVFKQPYAGVDQRYFLRGIVSVSPRSKTTSGCDKDSYAGYTDFSNIGHLDYLSRLL